MNHYYIFITIILTGLACTKTVHDPVEEVHPDKEVEIHITTSRPATRSGVPDFGNEKERRIDELDLLVFKEDRFQYSRRAYKISEGMYKVTLKVDNAPLTAQAFANCRSLLESWENRGGHDDKPWSQIQAELTDNQPSRLVSDEGEILPMWGHTAGTVSETHVTGWNTVLLLRSVASVDAYIEQNDQTKDFILTDAHLYYAPNAGYLASAPQGDGTYLPLSPPGMQTILNTLRAGSVVQMVVENAQGQTVSKDALAGQLYLYDNDTEPSGISATRKFTRLILAGYYEQPDPVYLPGGPEVDQRTKSYYPLDFVYPSGQFRPLIRNRKYVFNVTKVTGPGYGSLEEAADEYPIHMNVDIIEWNQEEVEIGVQGKYYLSMERKHARLWRNAGSSDRLNLTYRILDDSPGESFALRFTTDTNGSQTSPDTGNPNRTIIMNDYFRVTLLHDSQYDKADFIVESLQDYTAGHEADEVRVRFRDLEFYIVINQLNYREEDWSDGGELPIDF